MTEELYDRLLGIVYRAFILTTPHHHEGGFRVSFSTYARSAFARKHEVAALRQLDEQPALRTAFAARFNSDTGAAGQLAILASVEGYPKPRSVRAVAEDSVSVCIGY